MYWYPDEREIRLVEVTASFDLGSDTPEVLPFRFAATDEVPFPSVLIVLSPQEWQAVVRDPSLLPTGFVNPVQIYPAA